MITVDQQALSQFSKILPSSQNPNKLHTSKTMVFGEIVEPTTRSLWENDYDDYPEPVASELVWSWAGTHTQKTPEVVDKLLIADTKPVTKILNSCLLTNSTLLCQIESVKLQVHNVAAHSYVITCDSVQESYGQIVEAIGDWILKSRETFVLTSAPVAHYQGTTSTELDNNIYCLSYGSNKCAKKYRKLNSPNLVTGFGADAFSYCIHNKKNCSLFIGYMHYVPIDTLSSKPFMELLHLMNIGKMSPFKLNQPVATHNLYM